MALHGTFANWLRHHPRLRILADHRTRLFGLDGVKLDVTGRSQPPKVPRECLESGPDCARSHFAKGLAVLRPLLKSLRLGR